MIQKRILKLAKILNMFTLDDIVITLELNKDGEKIALKYLKSLAENNLIKKISENQYIYLDPKAIKFGKPELDKKLYQPQLNQSDKLIIDITKYKNYEQYLNAPEWAKKRADKYLTLFHAAGSRTGIRLRLFIKEWNEQFPEMKTYYKTFLKVKRALKTKGVDSILAHFGNDAHREITRTRNEIYPYFKEFYLFYKPIKVTEVIKLAVEKYEKLNPGKKVKKYPSYRCLRREILKEYTLDELNKLRNFKIKRGKNVARKTS